MKNEIEHCTGTLADIFSESRRRTGLSLTEVSLKSGISRSAICRIESGREWPTPRVLLQLAQSLDADQAVVVGGFIREETRAGRLVTLATLLMLGGMTGPARAICSRLDYLDRELYSRRYRGDVNQMYGRLAYLSGQFDEACDRLARVERAAAHATVSRRGRAQYEYGIALAMAGRWSAAATALHTACESFYTIGEKRLAASATRSLWTISEVALQKVNSSPCG